MGIRNFALGTLVALLGPGGDVDAEKVGLDARPVQPVPSTPWSAGHRVEGPGFVTWQESALEARAWARELRGERSDGPLLTACGLCGRVSGRDGAWHAVPFDRHDPASLSHGFCPDCARRHHPDLFDEL